MANLKALSYLSRVGGRWRTLILIGLTAFVLDQWTKLLAVQHLTPTFVVAHAKTTGTQLSKLTIDEREALMSSIGPLQALRYFYGGESTRFEGAVLKPAPSMCRPGDRCPRIHVIGGFWDWHYAENPGAAWSIFATASETIRLPFLIGVSFAAMVAIILFLRKVEESQKMTRVALALICGGALGNLIDRARLGYVIDFIEWYSGNLRWPTFNVADAAISTGVSLIILGMLLDLRAKKSVPPPPAPLASPTP